MASFIDKTRVNTAVDKFSKFTFLNRHQTTAGFMQFGFSHCVELVPKQPYKVKASSFVRLEPMPVPTNGSIRINNRAFFVPYRTVWPVFNDFYNDVKGVDDVGAPYNLSTVPTVSDNILIDMFDDAICSTLAVGGATPDFVVVGSDGTTSNRVFTPTGKTYYKVLRQLGYTIDFNQQNTSFVHSALALLCAAKISYDWYAVTAYAMDIRYTQVQAIFNRRTTYSLTKLDLLALLQLLDTVHYDSDYFTAAWDNPYTPNDGSFSNYQINDITKGLSSAYSSQVLLNNTVNGQQIGSDNAVKLVGGTDGNIGYLNSISQFGLTALRSLTDWMKRNQIVGARTLDRYLARWGVKLTSDKLDRSYYIGYNRESILVGDVTSTADTTGANLGSFAGKGLAYNERTFEYTNDEELGMFFIISTIVPEVSYYQGESAHNMRISRTQFYQPEFDNLGVQTINKRELLCPLNGELTRGISNWDSQVFGFIPRYADYKVQLDKVTGDYVVPSLATGKDSWYIGRDMTNFLDTDAPTPFDNLAHSFVFTEGKDATQYNRIFYNTDGKVDNFNVSHVFEVTTTFPGSSLFDNYEFEDKGDKVNVDVNGVKVN